MLHPYSLTPLHTAVIANDPVVVKALANKYAECQDDLGFTALELAQLLGHSDCLELLQTLHPPVFKVQGPDEPIPRVLNRAAFEDFFEISYVQFLKFTSYAHLREVVQQCPYLLRSRRLAADNYAYMAQFRIPLSFGMTAAVSIRWVSEEIGYGLFAEQDMLKGSYVGEYTGEVRQLSRRQHDENAYCLHYPTKWWSLAYYVIDAARSGNVTRFINHSDRPNVQPLCAVDRGLLHPIFVARNFIAKDEQLTLNYGQDYWLKRRKLEVGITRPSRPAS